MPILWRHLATTFLRIYFLCLSVFIAVLLVIRFGDIAQFATLGSDKLQFLKFVVVQIPEILPIATPISALIASFISVQRLSEMHVITAMRAAGMHLGDFLFPFQSVGVFLTLVALLFTCSLTPYSRTVGRSLLFEVTMNNPLVLLQKNRLIQMKESYLDMDMVRSGEKAQNVTLVFKNHRSGRLNLLMAKELQLNRSGALIGKELTLMGHIPIQGEGFDHLVIDNERKIETPREALRSLTQGKQGRLSLSEAPLSYVFKAMFSKLSKVRRKGTIELSKRLSFALAPLAFVMLGAVLGLSISRGRTRKGLVIATALCMTTFSLFLTARSLSKRSYLPVILYAMPYPILYLCGKWYVYRINRGVE